jgi:hypothetical protein
MSDLKSAVYASGGKIDEASRYVKEAEGYKQSKNIKEAIKSYNQASMAYLVAHNDKRQSV